MRYGIIGSRKRYDKQAIFDLVKNIAPGNTIVSGGCAGPDTWAEDAARAAGLNIKIFLPDLPSKTSPRYEFTNAFYARNRLIAENCDILHAFVSPDRKGGTEYTIKYAQKIGVAVVIHPPFVSI